VGSSVRKSVKVTIRCAHVKAKFLIIAKFSKFWEKKLQINDMRIFCTLPASSKPPPLLKLRPKAL